MAFALKTLLHCPPHGHVRVLAGELGEFANKPIVLGSSVSSIPPHNMLGNTDPAACARPRTFLC
jgi:hypothetical protein